MKSKSIILLSVFAVISIAIWIATPYWFADFLLYTNDAIIFILILLNGYATFKSKHNLYRYIFIIHLLCVLELLLVSRSLGCTESLTVRGDYFLLHYIDWRFPFRGEVIGQLLFPLEVIILVAIVYLQIRVLRRAFST